MAVGNERMIVSLDIGTSKVVVLVAEVYDSGDIQIKGMGTHPSTGLRKGVVVNIETTVNAINKAIAEAEIMAGCQIHSVYAGIAGGHIHSVNSHGIVAVKEREVTEADISRVIDAAQAVVVPADKRTLHTLPQEYVIDEQDGIREPVGMVGVRLEAWVHLVTCASNAAHNIERCINRCNLGVSGIILEQLASSYAVLTEDEKELGVCLVDIGGGTTDIAVFTKGSIRHTATIPVAGDHVTNDIAIALRLPAHEAEEIKIKYARVVSKLVGNKEVIRVSGIGEKSFYEVSRQFLEEVVEPRYEEIFELIWQELVQNGFEDLVVSGVVLTGGTSKMEGAVKLAESVFKIPVRLGAPLETMGMQDVLNNPIYATAVGLLQYGYNLQSDKKIIQGIDKSKAEGKLRRLQQWFQNNF